MPAGLSTTTPWPPAPASPAGPGRRGCGAGTATSTLRCCPSRSGSSAPSIRTRSPPAPTSPVSTGEAEDAAEARDQFAALLLVVERVYGVKYRDTLHDHPEK